MHKWNAFYVISGELDINVDKNGTFDITRLGGRHSKTLAPTVVGDFTTVAPCNYHEFKCWQDAEALEIYYTEPLSEDIIRDTVGGRITS